MTTSCGEQCQCDLCDLARRIKAEKAIMSDDTLEIIRELWARMEEAETAYAMLQANIEREKKVWSDILDQFFNK
jgi:hypothetical protein